MSSATYVVALIGAMSDVGREVRQVLRERAVPVAELRLYDDPGDDVEIVWGDEDPADDVLGLDAIELDGADVVFLCAHPELVGSWAARAASAGALAIDVTHASADVPEAMLVIPEVNPQLIDEAGGAGLLACPTPGATALGVVLHPLHAAAELRRVVVTAFEPASSEGRAGVEELAQQTRDLLSGISAEPAVFPHRIAFNAIPQLGDFVSGGRTRGEWLIESQTRRLLDLPDLPIAVTSVCVPIFFGHGYALNVETERSFDAAAAMALLRESPGVMLADESGPASYPTLADVIGSEATHVGRVRDDLTVPYGLALWAAIDGLRKGAAVNAVQIAERALRARG
jgi:aspartate-semialdehyde dehydrogenase